MNQGGQPNNEIWYTTTDGAALSDDLLINADFGASILTHKYEDGYGVITFDSAVPEIGTNAFLGCSTLASINLPNSISIISTNAFMECTSLTSITIPHGVTSIGWYAFSGCSSLTSVTIPDSVKTIRGAAFEGTSITRVDISDLTAWCNIEFNGNESNPLHNGANLYISGVVNNHKFSVPEDVVHINDYAFCGLSGFIEVNIPSTVTSVGVGAFKNAGFSYLGIDSIAMESIGDYAFASTNISAVYFVGAPPRDVGTDIFGSNYSYVSIYVPSEYLEEYKALLPQYNIQGL